MKTLSRSAGFLSLLLLVALRPLGSFAEPFSARLASDEVEVSLVADEEEVSPDRDFHLTISTLYPAGLKVVLPEVAEMRGRFQGFTVAEGFRKEPERLEDGRIRVEERWRLVPEPVGRCRLAPYAIELRPPAGSPSPVRSFATSPVLFPVAEMEEAAGDVEISPEPYWIPPTMKMVVGWVLVALLTIALAVVVFFLARRFRIASRLRRLSPSERAYAELEALLNLRLPQKGLYKDFYIELTQVVRRYIERAHGIRAPEQTTEEFLAAAKDHPRFTREVIVSLSDFLRHADLVKFARHDGSTTMAEEAVGTARGYIETDTEATRRLEAETSHPRGAEEARP